MSIYTAYTSTSLDFLVDPVTLDPGGPTTLIGAVVRVDALNLSTKAKVAGLATVITATSVRCFFAAGDLVAGRYEVQLRATVGSVSQIISETTWAVKPGAAP